MTNTKYREDFRHQKTKGSKNSRESVKQKFIMKIRERREKEPEINV